MSRRLQQYKVRFKPLFQPGAPLADRKNGEPSAKFSNGDDAQVQRSIVLRVNPTAYPNVRHGPGEFRGNIRVKQKAAVHSSPGRSVEGSRLKSTSSVRPLTIAHTSTRLFLPSRFLFSALVTAPAGRWR